LIRFYYRRFREVFRGPLKSLPDSESHLKPGTTFEKLDEIILSISDNEAVKKMNEAKHKLYKSIFEQKQSVA
ncbi:MAG: hypothetical protein GY786_06550, partial [Proteobacteria bacterium]|nr:hypothetical protein [Pseudomonadota bacterium]